MTTENTVAELLSRAKAAITAGEKSWREAAELIADAAERGATQRETAEAVGRSKSWINRLLKWREGGFQDDGPFTAGNAAAKAKKRVQYTGQSSQATLGNGNAVSDEDAQEQTAPEIYSAEEEEATEEVEAAEEVEAETAEDDDNVAVPEPEAAPAVPEPTEPNPNKEKVAAFLSAHNSDYHLRQFKGACDTYLPKLNAADLEKANEYFVRVCDRQREKKAA